jgi:hypothetical protein
MANKSLRAQFAKRFLSAVLACAAIAGAACVASPAFASPTDGGFPWSWGGLRVSAVTQGGDNDVYAQFKNPDGSVKNVWPDSKGSDLCAGATTLRVSRARANFKEIVDALNLAGLSGRQVWVAYEPTAGVCYVKALSVTTL